MLGIGKEHRGEQHCLLATLNSFAYDYFVRQKTMQPSLPIGPVYETVIPPPDSFLSTPAWAPEPLSRWIADRVVELVCVSTDLVSFARATIGHEAVFKWNPERRELLQAELDAALFHHFEMSRSDVEHVLSTFPKVREYDHKRYGEFRTATRILAIYDNMAAAARSGTSYQTPLSPPPAHESLLHDLRHGGRYPAVKSAVGPHLMTAPVAAVVPDLSAIAADAWARPHIMERGEIQAAVIAVLKASEAPMDRRQARLASLLCLEPHLLVPMLDQAEKVQWARVHPRSLKHLQPRV